MKMWLDLDKLAKFTNKCDEQNKGTMEYFRLAAVFMAAGVKSTGMTLEQLARTIGDPGEEELDAIRAGDHVINNATNLRWTQNMVTAALATVLSEVDNEPELPCTMMVALEANSVAVVTHEPDIAQALRVGMEVAKKRGF